MSMQINVLIRWMIRRDMPEVLDIENEAFPNPWSEDDFIRYLRQRNCIGMVAEYGDSVVGFVVYELHLTRIHVCNLAVTPKLNRCGVGTQIVEKMKSKLSKSSNRRQKILVEVRETNLAAQLFFRAMGFRAVQTISDFYTDSSEDAYVMQFAINNRKPFVPVNRISRLVG